MSLVVKNKNIVLCGFNDWRVPTRSELKSLVDYNGIKPVANASIFPSLAFNIGDYNYIVYWAAFLFVGDDVSSVNLNTSTRGEHTLTGGHDLYNHRYILNDCV